LIGLWYRLYSKPLSNTNTNTNTITITNKENQNKIKINLTNNNISNSISNSTTKSAVPITKTLKLRIFSIRRGILKIIEGLRSELTGLNWKIENKGKELKVTINKLWCLIVGWIKDKLFKINYRDKKAINICLIIGIILTLLAPLLIFSITGINLYETSSILDQESVSYSEMCLCVDIGHGHAASSYFFVRISLAFTLFYLVFYLILINYEQLITCSWANKILQGSDNIKVLQASALIKVIGGFEGLGEPNLDDEQQKQVQQETPKPTRSLNSTAMEVERNSLSMSATHMHMERQREISQGLLTAENSSGPSVPIPIPTGFSNSERFLNFKYIMGLGNPCPWKISPSPPREIQNPPLNSISSEEGEPYSISSWNGEPLPSITSIHNNNDHRVRFIENVQEYRDTETNNLKFKDILPTKSSKSEPSANLISNGQGEVKKPASNSELQSLLKDLLKK
jgi:hypothetical protein